MLKHALCLFALLLAACGGGSGGANSAPSTPAPVVRSAPPEFGYFGVIDNQVAETAAHTSFVFAMDWSEPFWSTPTGRQAIELRIIGQLQEAKARGVKHAWVGIGFLVFDAAPGCNGFYCYAPKSDLSGLVAFKNQLAALGLAVDVLYPVDEPNLHGLTDGPLSALYDRIKAVWPAKIATIYGDTQTYPGLSRIDIACKDVYGKGSDVLNELPPVTGAQQNCLVPGGADGLSSHGPDNPQPFYDYAMAHANVYGIVAFVWGDRGPNKGIRDNGQAPAYVAIGCKVTGKC